MKKLLISHCGACQHYRPLSPVLGWCNELLLTVNRDIIDPGCGLSEDHTEKLTAALEAANKRIQELTNRLNVRRPLRPAFHKKSGNVRPHL